MPIEEIITEDITCKNCGSTAVVRFGKYKGVQRYYCKVCKRKFKGDADLFHMKVPADYVSSALSMYYSGMSVNDICTTLKQEHNYYPSNSVVYKWIEKYTPIAIKHFRDYHASYIDSIEKVFGSDTDHIQTTPFEKGTEDTTSEIERFHGTLKDRTKVFRSFRDIDTLIEFTDGWLVYYNYFRPHESLDGKTPAEKAHLKYDVKNWADLMRIPVPKQHIEIESIPTPKLKRIKTIVNPDSLMKRHRGHRQPKEVDLGSGIVQGKHGRHLKLT